MLVRTKQTAKSTSGNVKQSIADASLESKTQNTSEEIAMLKRTPDCKQTHKMHASHLQMGKNTNTNIMHELR